MRTNEEELDLFADLIEPAAEILGDKEVAEILRSGGKPARAIRTAIKKHKSAVIEILARIDGKDPSEYKVSAITLPAKLLTLFNKPEAQEVFTLLAQMSAAEHSGSHMENTEDGVQ